MGTHRRAPQVNSTSGISIIVPTLNEVSQITALFDALARDPGISEIIVVDGGSQDDTVRRLQKHVTGTAHAARLQLIAFGEAGRAKQMNHGARGARGDWLVFLHADTRLPDHVCEHLIAAGQAGHVWGRFDMRFDTRRFPLPVIAWFMNQRSAVTGIATGDQGMFVRRSVFESVRGFPDIALMEDIALSKILKRITRPYRVRTPVTTAARRWRQQGVVATVLRMWRFRIMYWVGVSPDRLSVRYPHVR